MPLTFLSHQAVVLPLKIAAPRWTSGTALVIGSMAPDVEYILRTYPGGVIGHTWPGQLIFCLPVSIALFLIVTRIIARPLVAHLPDAGSLRLRDYALLREQPTNLAHWFVVGACALIGSASHVVLDRLSGGWSMYNAAQYGAWFPFSRMTADWHWVAFKLATWALLAIATILMMRYIGSRALLRRWARERGGSGSPEARSARTDPAGPVASVWPRMALFWPTVVVFTLVGGALGAIFRRPGFFMHQPATWVHIGLAAMAAGFMGLVAASVAWHRSAHRPVSFRGTTT